MGKGKKTALESPSSLKPQFAIDLAPAISKIIQQIEIWENIGKSATSADQLFQNPKFAACYKTLKTVLSENIVALSVLPVTLKIDIDDKTHETLQATFWYASERFGQLRSLQDYSNYIEITKLLAKLATLVDRKLDGKLRYSTLIEDIFCGIAHAHIKLNNLELAESYLYQCDTLIPNLDNTYNTTARLNNKLMANQNLYEGRGAIALQRGQLTLAKKYLKTAEKYCLEQNAKSPQAFPGEQLTPLYEQLSLKYLLKKDFQNALKYSLKVSTLRKMALEKYKKISADPNLTSKTKEKIPQLTIELKSAFDKSTSYCEILAAKYMSTAEKELQLILPSSLGILAPKINGHPLTIQTTNKTSAHLLQNAFKIYKLAHECHDSNLTITFNALEKLNLYKLRKALELAQQNYQAQLYQKKLDESPVTVVAPYIEKPLLKTDNVNTTDSTTPPARTEPKVKTHAENNNSVMETGASPVAEIPTENAKILHFDTDCTFDPTDKNNDMVMLWGSGLPKDTSYAKFCEPELRDAFIKAKYPLEILEDYKKNIFAKGHIVGPFFEKGFKYSKKEGVIEDKIEMPAHNNNDKSVEAPNQNMKKLPQGRKCYFFKLKDPTIKVRIWGWRDTYVDEAGKQRDVWRMDKVTFKK